ncbi:hypothetical protein HN385_08000 [archaeon]|jgi:threonine dehydratase|nr:hypothetical protein [archaeon]
MNRSIIVYFENINTQEKQPLTPLQKLQAENKRRREELDDKRDDLQDTKSFRQIGSVLVNPYIQNKITGLTAASMSPKSLNMVDKLGKGKYYLEKKVTL